MALANDLAHHTVAVVLAGGNGSRLDPLTREICKPALPFAGVRSIDFTLSNCLNSGIDTIGVPVQYKPAALLAHLASHWSPRATAGRATVTPWRADERAPRLGYRGTADAVYRNVELIDESGRCLVLVLAGDHVYKMDYRPMLEAHCSKGAGVTIGCAPVPRAEAHQYGVVAAGDDGRIERFVEKPRSPAELPAGGGESVLASMGIYVFDADFLTHLLTLDAFAPGSRHDFGADILPKLIGTTRAFAFTLGASGGGPAYWRDIGTLGAYWRAHMELLGPAPRLTLDDPRWPIGTAGAAPRPTLTRAHTERGGTIDSSLVTASAAVAGHATRSVLCDDVEIGRGAQVTESIVLPGAVVGARCRLRGVIVDARYRVPDGTVIDRDADAGEPFVLSAQATLGTPQSYAHAS